MRVTKLSDSEYSLKVQLNCGEQNDYILETIGCTTVCSNGTCKTVLTNDDKTVASKTLENEDGAEGEDSAVERDYSDRVGNAKDVDNTIDGSTIKVTLYQHKKAIVTTKTVYTCPEGYTKSGEGENTKCSKVLKGENKYYCEDADAKLDGTKCIKTVKGTIKDYTCPEGYTKNGTKCTKQTTVTIDATVSTSTSTSYKYKWSEKSELEGWEFTGKTKTQTKNYSAGQK